MPFIVLIISLFSFSLEASLHRPPSIEQARGQNAVFVDFKTAKYEIVYDLKSRKAYVNSEIEFEQLEEGFPVFDLVPQALSAELDQVKVEIGSIELDDGKSKVKFAKRKIAPGLHILKIRNRLEKNVQFNIFPRSLRSAFWMSDLSQRSYLEQYFPTNLEYDQFSMTMTIKVENAEEEYTLMVNGNVEKWGAHEWRVLFPEHFTTSSLYFHLFPKGTYTVKRWLFKGNEKEFPVTLYGRTNLDRFEEVTNQTLQELENDYGAWPHKSLVIYATPSGGGMEHCGATITSLYALGHELTHSYFARGMMPANGNAGWIDEAIASWRDGGYSEKSLGDLSPTRMAGYSPYWRITDRNAYTRGADFIGHLHSKFIDQGGFKTFLRNWKDTKLFTPYLTSEFKNSVEQYFSSDLIELFDRYIYGNAEIDIVDETLEENPYHPVLTEEELRAYL